MFRKILKTAVFSLVVFVFISCKNNLNLVSTNVDNSLTPVKVENQDESTLEAIKPYKNQLDEKMNEVIGFAPEELKKADYQSPLGNFVIDLIKYQSEKSWGKNIDIAVVTNGGLRSPIPKGDVTTGNIFELMPFNNEIVVLELTEKSVLEMMNYAATKKNAVFSGVKYKVEGEKAKEILINGEVLNAGKTYTCAVSDYLAGGGDKMVFLKDATKTHQIGLLFREAILKHIKELTTAQKQIAGRVDNRVEIVD